MKRIFSMFFIVFLLLTFVATTNAQSDESSKSNKNQKDSIQQQENRGINVKRKPGASAEGCQQKSGIAIVKVTFDKAGKITNSTIFKESGCKIFDENTIEAAKRIKFDPQLKAESL